MSAATIPLMFQPTTAAQNPLDTYSKLLSLRNMQAQMQQAQQLDPLIIQQQQAAAQEAQLRVQQQQRAMQDQKFVGDAMRAASSGVTQGPGTPKTPAPEADPDYQGAGVSPPAAAPPASTPGATYPVTALAVPADPNGPAYQSDPAYQATGVAPPATAFAANASGMVNNPGAQQAAATDPTAAFSANPDGMVNNPIAQQAAMAPPPAPAQAVAATPYSVASLRNPAASGYTPPAAPAAGNTIPFRPGTHPIDLMQVAYDALRRGASPATFQALQKQALDYSKELALTQQEQQKVDKVNNDKLLNQLDWFRSQNQDYQEKGWKGFLQEANNDGILSDKQYTAMQQANPEGVLPDRQTLDHFQVGLQLNSGALEDSLKKQQLATERAAQRASEARLGGEQSKSDFEVRSNAVGLLANAATPAKYDAIKKTLDPKLASTLPDSADVFNSDGTADPDAVGALRRMGMTPDQQVIADRTEAARLQTVAHQKVTESQGNTRIAIARQAEADRARSQTDKDAIGDLASKYYTLYHGDPDAASAAVKASTDPKEQRYALQAVTMLQTSKATGLKPAEIQAETDRANRTGGKGSFAGRLTGGKDDATSNPAGTPKPKSGAPAQITVYPANGDDPQTFPDEASAQKYEAHIRAVGGTTSREPRQ